MSRVIINGQERDIDSRTVDEMIAELKITASVAIVEKNGRIVSKENYAKEPIAQGDEIEIIRLMGGG